MANSQSKTFWSFLILVDVLLLIAFGWALADRLYGLLEDPAVSIMPAHLPRAKSLKPGESKASSAASKAQEAPAEPSQKTTTTPKKEAKQTPPASAASMKDAPAKAKKVVILYRNEKAKKVFVEGSFTKWKPRPMQKRKDGWAYAVYLLPGADYPYRFVVDGKIIADPANPHKKWGKSYLPVE